VSAPDFTSKRKVSVTIPTFGGDRDAFVITITETGIE